MEPGNIGKNTNAKEPEQNRRTAPPSDRLAMAVPDSIAEALVKVLGYLWDDEASDFEQSEGVGRDFHIFLQLVYLREWLDSPRTVRLDRFGVCPVCLDNDGCLDVGGEAWFVCHAHRVRWLGPSVFADWGDQTEDERRAKFERIRCYVAIEPVY